MCPIVNRCGLSFSNYGNVPTCQIAIDSKWHKTTPLLFQFIATVYDTQDSTLDAR